VKYDEKDLGCTLFECFEFGWKVCFPDTYLAPVGKFVTPKMCLIPLHEPL
jgi:hypothetical protein